MTTPDRQELIALARDGVLLTDQGASDELDAALLEVADLVGSPRQADAIARARQL